MPPTNLSFSGALKDVRTMLETELAQYLKAERDSGQAFILAAQGPVRAIADAVAAGGSTEYVVTHAKARLRQLATIYLVNTQDRFFKTIVDVAIRVGSALGAAGVGAVPVVGPAMAPIVGQLIDNVARAQAGIVIRRRV